MALSLSQYLQFENERMFLRGCFLSLEYHRWPAINVLEGIRDNSFSLCCLSLHALLVVGADRPHYLSFALPNRWCRICVLTINLPWAI